MQNFSTNILKTTKERLKNDFLEHLNNPNIKFDVHTHIFNIDFIPEDFFSVRIPMLVNVNFLKGIDSLLDFIQHDEEDKLYKYAYFIDFILKNSTEQIAEYLVSNSPQNTVFCSLLIDFSKGLNSRNVKSIEVLMDKIRDIRNQYPALFLPFIGIDPNNPKCFDLFEKAFSSEYQFFGVKVYPALGFLPSHPNLMKIFEVCSQYNIPVTTHSGYGGIHTNKNKINLKYFDIDKTGALFLTKDTKQFFFNKQYERFFNRPQHWEPVLKAFPSLRLNLSHFGGEIDRKDTKESEFIYRTLDLMERYSNVYSDLAYTIHNEYFTDKFIEMFQNNKLISERTLFGTDFYMINLEGKYKELRSKFVTKIGSKIMHKISVENPLNFLNLKEYISQEIRQSWEQQTL